MDASSVVLTSGCAAVVDPVVNPGVRDALGHAIALASLDDDDTWVARTALQITEAVTAGHATPPLLLVLTGDVARHAPALGFAQRAARRSVRGYVLVDPALPRPGQVSDWPDAPVVVVLTTTDDSRARDARLRGWEVLTGDAAQLIAEVASRP